MSPVVGVGLGVDAAAVRLGDGAADRQAHAEAARLGGDEALEDLLEIHLVAPGPVSRIEASTRPGAGWPVTMVI
jgi:hypothetical protein